MNSLSSRRFVAVVWGLAWAVGCGGTAAAPQRDVRSVPDGTPSSTPAEPPDPATTTGTEAGQPDEATQAEVSVPVAAGTMRNGTYFMTADAPDPLACTEDSQCAAVSVVAEDGCCIANPPIPRPAARAWSNWKDQRRSSDACRDVECPPVAIPSEPDACYFDLHCVDGRCANGCPAEWMPPVVRE